VLQAHQPQLLLAAGNPETEAAPLPWDSVESPASTGYVASPLNSPHAKGLLPVAL